MPFFLEMKVTYDSSDILIGIFERTVISIGRVTYREKRTLNLMSSKMGKS